MIYIQSIKDDGSTTDVMDWIYYLSSYKIKRINEKQPIEDISFYIRSCGDRIQIKTRDYALDSDEIGSYWYRRGTFSFDKLVEKSFNRELAWASQEYLQNELQHVSANIFSSLKENNNGINKAQDNETNKLTNLRMARNVGLSIPDTLICTEKHVLLNFLNEHKRVISKVINSSLFQVEISAKEKIRVGTNVKLLQINDMEKLNDVVPDKFLPSLFQNYINKKFELRIFYLNGLCYPMAIFSQENEKTKVDFRNYDYSRPNRCVTYNLPEIVNRQIINLMNSLDLNSGSIDMIYSTSDEYVFLEVNPIGQYQWLDRNCNFYLDKKIAEHLISKYEN